MELKAVFLIFTLGVYNNEKYSLNLLIKVKTGQVCWCTCVIPALGRQRQGRFEISLGYIGKLCLQEKGKQSWELENELV
jgi:hypothetical protein